MFPLVGAGVRALRNLLTGRERPEDETILATYLDGLASGGALGIVYDMLEGSAQNKTLEFFGGPTAVMAKDLLESVRRRSRTRAAASEAVRRESRPGAGTIQSEETACVHLTAQYR